MTPILIFFFGIKPYLAVGTDLLFAAFTKGAGTLSLAQQRLVPWRVVFTLSAGSLPAAALTLWVLHEVGPAEPAVQQVMKSTLGVALLLTALAMLYKAIRGKKAPQSLPEDAIETAIRPRHWALPVLFGGVIGVLVTLTSVGAGAIGVSVLMILYPRLPLSRIVASDIAYAVPLTAIAAIGHWWLGSINWELLGMLLLGSVPGITIGSLAARAVPEKFLRGLLATTLTGVAAKLVL